VDIAVWLLGLGLEQYEPAFRANEIDTSVLPRLTAVGNREETAMSRLLKFRWLQIAVLFSNVIGFGLFSAPAGAAGDTVHLTAPHRQTGSGQFLITTLSARNDLLSGDSALIRVGVSSAIPLTQVGVYLNGVKVTSAFQETPPGSHVLQGLATGLRRGDNTLLIRDERNQSTSSQLTLTDYPITGPILSGPHITPYECRTTQNGLGSPLDSDCSAATKIAYYYRSTSKTFKALTRPTGPRPTDLALTTTTDGRTVPYIVRVESGTINRGVYRIAILDDPAQSSTGPWKPGFGWNGKLVVTFGCCGSAQYNQGVISPDAILSDTELSRGFAFAHSTELFNPAARESPFARRNADDTEGLFHQELWCPEVDRRNGWLGRRYSAISDHPIVSRPSRRHPAWHLVPGDADAGSMGVPIAQSGLRPGSRHLDDRETGRRERVQHRDMWSLGPGVCQHHRRRLRCGLRADKPRGQAL